MEGDFDYGGDCCGGEDFDYQATESENFSEDSFGISGNEMTGEDGVGTAESDLGPGDGTTFDSGAENLDAMEMRTNMMKKALKDQEKYLLSMNKQQKAHYKKQMDELKKAEERVKLLRKKAEVKGQAKPIPRKGGAGTSNQMQARMNAEMKARQAAQNQQRIAYAKRVQQQRYMMAQRQNAMQRAALTQQQAMMEQQMAMNQAWAQQQEMMNQQMFNGC